MAHMCSISSVSIHLLLYLIVNTMGVLNISDNACFKKKILSLQMEMINNKTVINIMFGNAFRNGEI